MNGVEQEVGRLQAEVQALRRDNDRLLHVLERLTDEVGEMRREMSEAKGGWKVLMLIGGASATLGGGVTWALTHLFGKGLP